MATYTSIDDLDLSQIAARYGWDDLHLEALHGGAANSSFKATAEQGDFVLTILDNHDLAGAEALTARTEALFRLGVPTTEVIHDVGGRSISVISGRPVMVKRWIEGQVVDPLPSRLLPAAGELLAHLHDLPQDVPDLPARTRRLSPEHLKLIEEFPDRRFAEWLSERLDAVRREEGALPSVPDVVSHGDLFADNLILRPDDKLAVIDWETVSLDSALLDLGMTLLGLANVAGRLDHDRAHQIVTGYTKVRPLSDEEVATLPTEVEHAALIIAFHRYHRHNIRFPDERKRHLHEEMYGFVDSLPGF
ncbi:phosphotransferase [Actinoallomurus purpureus]|uniref:phosphotransferase n=1 Tax=Actinoallomurus purpureus TaxID=478114 RepID=UPI0020933693|nr:phosphotransferase [Actinoallomurus purpureus]MCO6003389.1 phosphotransferase [Actinoallomurus purpureus]